VVGYLVGEVAIDSSNGSTPPVPINIGRTLSEYFCIIVCYENLFMAILSLTHTHSTELPADDGKCIPVHDISCSVHVC